jgi:hypothetical protein
MNAHCAGCEGPGEAASAITELLRSESCTGPVK